jgi:subtilase family serine protease
MVRFGMPGRPGATRGGDLHRRRWAAAGCAMAVAAAGGAASSGGHQGRASGAPALADSSVRATPPGGPATPGFLRGAVGPSCFQYPPSCYASGAFRVAYGIQALLDRGIDGRGQAVVMPEIANQPPAGPPKISDIRLDLARFDSLNHIPAARLRVVTKLAPGAAPYLADPEEVEDVEIVHAVAPAATIVVVQVPPSAGNSPASFLKAIGSFLRLAIPRGDVVSISASLGEHFVTHAQAAQLNAILRAAREHHVTVVSSSGDSGAASDQHFGSAPIKEVSLPAADPLVLSAGGTSLALRPKTGAYTGEIAWNPSGGGFSHLFGRPSYQDGVPGAGATRGVPDVAADADSGTGMALAVADSAKNYTQFSAGGTSAAAPLWAGVIALADQAAGRPLGFVNAGLYRIGRSSLGVKAFHDVTTGGNSLVLVPRLITGYQAAPGWDPVTGWGSPNAGVLVPLLAHDAQP